MNVETLVDPVCRMTVDLDHARSIGLTAEHQGVIYAFCARGCKLDFLDSPSSYAAGAAGGPTGMDPVGVRGPRTDAAQHG